MPAKKASPVKFYLNIVIASVWLINGLFCKILNMVPRHRMIVSKILGEDISGVATNTIGILECLMAIWILSKILHRWCAITQSVIILTMNIIEFAVAPDLLLFGRINIILALVFTSFILFNEYKVQP